MGLGPPQAHVRPPPMPLSDVRSLFRCVPALALLALGACVAPGGPGARGPDQGPITGPDDWQVGEVLLQGYVGASVLSDLTLRPPGAPSVELEDEEILPAFGGGAELKLAGQRVTFGLEALVAFSGRSDLEAFATGGGGGVVAFDVDLLIVEVYGGPFLSVFLGERLRLYGGAGPVLQWVGYEQDDGTDSEDADGSGGGFYVRGGLEFLLPSRRWVGFGARWSETSLDFSGDFGDLDIDGLELFVSYSYGHQPRGPYGRF